MPGQLALPFVALVGASPAAPPEAFPEVSRPRRAASRPRLPRQAARDAEMPPRAHDIEAPELDIHAHLVRRDEESFIFSVGDDAMAGSGLFAGDQLVVDTRLTPAHGQIVLAHAGGERLVRRLYHRGRKTSLQAEHPDFEEIVFEDGSELTIWGVVVGMFRRIQA